MAPIHSIHVKETAIAARLMLRGINNKEATAWLKGIRDYVPRHVFQSVMALAGTGLSVHRREALREAALAEIGHH